MNYENFFEELEEYVFDIPEVSSTGAEVTFHLRGETAHPDDRETERFIRDTNMKYFRTECGELLGDFAELRIPCASADDRTSFIRFEIQALYDVFVREGWDGVTALVLDNIGYALNIEGNAGDVLGSMTSYEKIRDRLIIRPLNLKNNRESLKGYVYKCLGDIALVLYAVVLDDDENGCLNTVKIPEAVFREWNIDKDSLLVSTILNTSMFAMPRLYRNILDIENTPESESAFMAADYVPAGFAPGTIPLVTTTRKTNGAIAMFYPGVKEKIAEMFDDSFYVAFTSIHEAMVHKKGSIDPSSIRRHLKATNKTFGSEDTLSDNVFYFDRDTRVFSVVSEE